MNIISDRIKLYKEKREKLIALQKVAKQKRYLCDTIQFYEDSLKLSNINEGMVIVITKDSIIKERTPKEISHKKVTQTIIDDIFDKPIDLDNVSGDFGNVIPEEYDSILIRMVSILNGASIIYYPKNCSEFQIAELTKFNNEVKAFNMNQKEALKACFVYDGKGNNTAYDIDDIIREITKKNIITR